MRPNRSDPLLSCAERSLGGSTTCSGGTDPLLTHFSAGRVFIGHWPSRMKNARVRKPVRLKHFRSKAGEGIRTLDVQLGKLAFYH
jgi:hypothetical protein